RHCADTSLMTAQLKDFSTSSHVAQADQRIMAATRQYPPIGGKGQSLRPADLVSRQCLGFLAGLRVPKADLFDFVGPCHQFAVRGHCHVVKPMHSSQMMEFLARGDIPHTEPAPSAR